VFDGPVDIVHRDEALCHQDIAQFHASHPCPNRVLKTGQQTKPKGVNFSLVDVENG
jgi:hypothetical protein